MLPYRIDAVLYLADNGPEYEAILAECQRRLQAGSTRAGVWAWKWRALASMRNCTSMESAGSS